MKKIIIGIIVFIIASYGFCKGNIDKDLTGEYFAIAEAYSELKKYDKAIDYYSKTVKNEKYRRASQYNLAQLYALKNDWKNCISNLEPIYQEAPDNVKIATAYAYALASKGEEKKALDIYKKIYLQNSETPEYFFNYVRLLIIVKKYDEAKELLTTAKENFTKEEETRIIESLEKKIEEILNPPKKEKETDKPKNNTNKPADKSEERITNKLPDKTKEKTDKSADKSKENKPADNQKK